MKCHHNSIPSTRISRCFDQEWTCWQSHRRKRLCGLKSCSTRHRPKSLTNKPNPLFLNLQKPRSTRPNHPRRRHRRPHLKVKIWTIISHAIIWIGHTKYTRQHSSISTPNFFTEPLSHKSPSMPGLIKNWKAPIKSPLKNHIFVAGVTQARQLNHLGILRQNK